MPILREVLGMMGEALLSIVLNPFYYIGLLLALLVYRHQTLLERKLFSVRVHSMLREWGKAAGWGLAAGALMSLSTIGFGLVLTAETFLWLWGVTLLMLLAKLRFASFAYSAAIVALLQVVIEPVQQAREVEGLTLIIDSLLGLHLPSLLALAALLLLAEGLLIAWTGGKSSTPLYLEGKRGKVIGAYRLQGLWALPLFAVVPATSVGMEGFPWPLFFGSGFWENGWTLLAFPVMLGFAESSVSVLPQPRARRIAAGRLIMAVVIGLLAIGTELWPSPYLALSAALLLLVMREGWYIYSARRERGQSPAFVHQKHGLKVLDVLPSSPAEDMGIVRGELIVKANGMEVSSKEELHAALRTNPAFCKVEVVNNEDQVRFEQRALYDGEHHQLGLILCPDDRVLHYVEWKSLSLYEIFNVQSLRRSAKQRSLPPPAPTHDGGAGI